MMGRLIDADALIELFEEKKQKCDNLQQLVEMTGMQAIIDAQPTAYDTEKVIAELESFAKLAEDRWVNGTSNHAHQEHRCWVKAIEIVRKGGA